MIRSPMAAMEAGPWVLAWMSAPGTIYQSGYDADNMTSAAWAMLIIFSDSLKLQLSMSIKSLEHCLE